MHKQRKQSNVSTILIISQSGSRNYEVEYNSLGWDCSCPDHTYRGVRCKYIHAVEFSFALREQVKKEVVIQPINSVVCRYCNSENIVKKALRKNKQSIIQRFLCKDCGRRFSFNIGFDRMHTSPQMITSALQLYFTGESFRNIQKFLKLQGVKIIHVAIYKWIKKYVTLMKAYLDKITPNVADAWRADELYLKVRGNPKYLYAVMDDQTRFWIAQQVADNKYTANIRPLFAHAKEIAGKRPNTMITDGAP